MNGDFKRAAVQASVVCLLFSVACAFYNTFYYARLYYRQGLETERAAVSEKLSPRAAELYDKSMKKCAKVIAEYPDSKWVDDAIVLMGNCLYQKRSHDKALKKYEELLFYYPESDLVPEALLMMGRCYEAMKDADKARSSYERLVRDYQNTDAGREAKLSLALMSLGKKKPREALGWSQELLRGKGSKEWTGKATRVAGDAYFALAQYDSALFFFKRASSEIKEPGEWFEARLREGETMEMLGDWKGASGYYERLLNEVSSKEQGANVTLRLAQSRASLGEFERAIELYQTVTKDFPRHPLGAEAQFRMGYTYEIHLQNVDEAKKAYDLVPSFDPRSSFADLADTRSRNLARLKEYSSALNAGGQSEEAAETSFRLGEFYLFDLSDTAKACEQYKLVEEQFPESPFAPKAAFARAWMFQFAYEREDSARVLWRHVVDSYPGTPYAEQALKFLGGGEPDSASVGGASGDTTVAE